MQMRRIFLGTLVLAIVAIGQLFAQAQPKNSKKNSSHDTSSYKNENKTDVFLFPDILQYGLIKKGDTSFSYEYYDKDLKEINMFNLKDIDEIDHIKYLKIFSGLPVKKNSNVSPPVEYVLLSEFVHPATDLWLRYNPMTGEITRYSIYKNKIVGTDSVTVADPKTNNKRKLIYNYFKTEIKSTEKGQAHKHTK